MGRFPRHRPFLEHAHCAPCAALPFRERRVVPCFVVMYRVVSYRISRVVRARSVGLIAGRKSGVQVQWGASCRGSALNACVRPFGCLLAPFAAELSRWRVEDSQPGVRGRGDDDCGSRFAACSTERGNSEPPEPYSILPNFLFPKHPTAIYDACSNAHDGMT